MIEFAVGRQHANPMGTLHGGVLCDIADAAMGIAYASTLAERETFATLELKINFLKADRAMSAQARPAAAARAVRRRRAIVTAVPGTRRWHAGQ